MSDDRGATGGTLKDRLALDLKQAMKDRSSEKVQCIRMLRSVVQQRELAARAKHGAEHRIDDDEAQAAIATYAKQRRESIESYRAAGRDDLADAEQRELVLVSAYLPRQLDEQQIRTILQESIEQSGAAGPSGLGVVMKVAMPRLRGLADGKLVNRLARELLDRS